MHKAAAAREAARVEREQEKEKEAKAKRERNKAGWNNAIPIRDVRVDAVNALNRRLRKLKADQEQVQDLASSVKDHVKVLYLHGSTSVIVSCTALYARSEIALLSGTL